MRYQRIRKRNVWTIPNESPKRTRQSFTRGTWHFSTFSNWLNDIGWVEIGRFRLKRELTGERYQRCCVQPDAADDSEDVNPSVDRSDAVGYGQGPRVVDFRFRFVPPNGSIRHLTGSDVHLDCVMNERFDFMVNCDYLFFFFRISQSNSWSTSKIQRYSIGSLRWQRWSNRPKGREWRRWWWSSGVLRRRTSCRWRKRSAAPAVSIRRDAADGRWRRLAAARCWIAASCWNFDPVDRRQLAVSRSRLQQLLSVAYCVHGIMPVNFHLLTG